MNEFESFLDFRKSVGELSFAEHTFLSGLKEKAFDVAKSIEASGKMVIDFKVNGFEVDVAVFSKHVDEYIKARSLEAVRNSTEEFMKLFREGTIKVPDDLKEKMVREFMSEKIKDVSEKLYNIEQDIDWIGGIIKTEED